MAGLSKDPQMDHLPTEFYARFMQVIVESRIPEFMPASSHSKDGSTSSSPHRGGAPAFNLVLGKFGGEMDSMEPWGNHIQDPMVIDILFLRRGNDRVMEGLGQKGMKGAGNLFEKAPAGIAAFAKADLGQLILLERWTVEFRQHSSRSIGKIRAESGCLQDQKGMIGQNLSGAQNYKLGVGSSESSRSSGKREILAAFNVIEKKMAILLRSTYCTARLLPAQNLSRLLSTSGNSKFKIVYKVTSSPSASSNSKDMTQFYFTPIKTHLGHLHVSVAYRQNIPSTEHEMYKLCPQIIPDYVDHAASLQSRKLLAEKAEQSHSLPWLSSFKFNNLQLHQVPKKEVGTRNLDRAHTVGVGCSNFSLVEDERFECPFDIHDEQYGNRTEKAKLRSVKSDMAAGGYGKSHVPGGPVEAFQTFQRPAAPLSSAYQPKKDAANALKELEMYIGLRDRLRR